MQTPQTLALKHHLHHRVRRQRAVELVQLFAAGGCDGDGDAQVVAAFAFPQFDGFGIKGGVEFMGDEGDGVDKAIHFGSHDLDREGAGVDDEGFFNHGGGRHGGWLGRAWFGRFHGAIIVGVIVRLGYAKVVFWVVAGIAR